MANGSSSQQQRLQQRESQLLPWIADPLTHVLHHEHELTHASHQYRVNEKGSSKDAEAEEAVYEEIEAGEATSIELFYDLFFVANLTTITSVHEMSDYDSLISYILFFIILWFTWLQTSLYDIRFSVDSFYERLVKSIHFAVMIGFASVSTSWDPLGPTDYRTASNLQTMSLTLMASRFALGIQYAVAMIYAKKNKKPVTPFAIHSLIMGAAGLIYMGVSESPVPLLSDNTLYISLGVKKEATKYPRAYLSWYGVIFLEVVGVLIASSKWKVVSFKRTHLVERMGLLTLIIMGEGIIVMLKAVNAVEKSGFFGRGWSRSIFSVVACALLIIYMFYMFYFDYTPKNVHYGSIRQQIWAVMHFPFHLALVLAVEGLRQVTTWWSFHQAVKAVMRASDKAALDAGSDAQDQSVARLGLYKKIIDYIYKEGASKEILSGYTYLQDELTNLQKTPRQDWTTDQFLKFSNVTVEMVKGCTEFYGIKAPENQKPTNTTETMEILGAPDYNPFQDIDDLFDLVYQYFFSALGVVFLMYGILGLFVRRKKDMWDYISVGIRFVVGITFIGMVFLQYHTELYNRFYTSPWPIPTVCIIILVSLFIDKIVGVIAYKSLLSRSSTGSGQSLVHGRA
ncbi:bacterial low temperature requirement A protein-domain-containing protein [Trichophaea hybrida]|nr:bacterial low temperature requirement A protein-domain-containing protein [Trichophaea hybrida]